MPTNSPYSIHTLVRLLKSSTDPPTTPGPSKIEIAHHAWSDPSFCATNKGEVIGEWILALLGQANRTRGGTGVNPITDSRYWTLLCAVLTTPPSTATRPIKTWLLPLLNRFQVDAIVIELLALQSSQILAPARAALAVLWPLAEKKIGVDALAGCLGAVFNACAQWDHVDDDLGWICSAVIATYGNALVNVGNKKKLYNSFLTTQLSSWLCTVCPSPPHANLPSQRQLQDSIYAAGADTLFSPDALKQPLDTLFDALSTSVSSLLPVLPKLCTSFLRATHRHRSVLFDSATSVIGGKEELRKRGIEFIGRSWILIRDSAGFQDSAFHLEKWKSVIDLLRIVEKERLFVANPIRSTHTDATKGESRGELALIETRDRVIEMLETVDASSKVHQGEQTVLSIQLLDVFVQIEYDFVGCVLHRVLSALINIPQSLLRLITTASSEFLDHVLEYHIKTRTVHTYVLALLSAVAASSASPTPRTSISRSTMSTFPLAYHLPALARALRTSVAPTQTTPLATAVLKAADSAWRTFKDADEVEHRSSKKRKVAKDSDKGGREAGSMSVRARVFCFMGRVAGTILSNLPASAYAEDEEYSLEHLWGDVGKLGWTVIWDCLVEHTGKGDGAMKSRDGKKRKHSIESDTLSTPYRHAVASTALRFLYDVRARVSLLLGDSDRFEESHAGTLLNVARGETSDPELVLELIRTLLWHVWYTHNYDSQKRPETHPIFAVILDILTSHPLSQTKWSGMSADLTHENLSLAVLYVLTERWIDVFDALASTEQLERLVSLLLDPSLYLSDEDADIQDHNNETDPQRDPVVITLRGIIFGLLRNAQFWELHNIRAALLSSILTLTAPLSPYRFPTTGAESPPLIAAMAHNKLTPACDAYSLLLYVPPEYFTRSVRVELVKRAMAADVQICAALEDAKGQRSRTKKHRDRSDAGHRRKSHSQESDDRIPAVRMKEWSRMLTFVRIFSQRMRLCLGIPSHSISLTYVNHLLSPPSLSSPPKALTSVTLDLIQLHIASLLRSQEPEAAASVCGVISTFVTARPFSQPICQETWAQLVVQSSAIKLIERTTGNFDPASLQGEVKDALKILVVALESALSPLARRSMEADPRQLDQFLSSERINAWSRMLMLRRWLGMNCEFAQGHLVTIPGSLLAQTAAAPFGLKLAISTIRNDGSARPDSETCSSILTLLFEELRCMPDATHGVHLDVLVSFYTVNGGDRDSDIERILDDQVTQASKKMSVEDFSHLLTVLGEGIGGSGLQAGHRERIIHLGQIVLHDAPPGTLKVIQHFAAQCFNLFADREEIYGGTSQVKLQCLKFIARHCSDRPAAIRSMDLGSIWSLLNRILSGSSEHDATTVFPIFHHVVAIIGALIRLRRDLVVHTLPQLGLVLRQLMMLTRKIRPQLGAKQSRIVTDTFPSWLSASRPLSTDEARALARLLTSLTTKTVPRTHISASTESQKAESLAKPFAKHASYVLVAYVDAFNDPLCIINAEMRKDLEPGLFALCEMVGEHSRDALMVSALNSGGKTIMKSLWKEYEKQRYVGKG